MAGNLKPRVRRAVDRFATALGIEVTRLSGPHVRYENFESLCAAYEQRLAESG